jgi:phosphotransferase system HPr-like phosphotransfer protein
MQVTMLAATKGTKLKIIAVGSDAEEAVKTLAVLIENGTTDNSG